MKVKFENDFGVIIKETDNNIFIPRKNDLIVINNVTYEVDILDINYDKNIIMIYITQI